MADLTPPGWSANPSAWLQRLPILALALVGASIAGYLAGYQLRLVSSVWEPFFGDGSRVILNSSVSRVLPIPDAALGVFGYLLDAVTGAIGGRARSAATSWRGASRHRRTARPAGWTCGHVGTTHGHAPGTADSPEGRSAPTRMGPGHIPD
ncbi:MAG TPA: vitamin K epoxide reductase family protein [Candidatus Binatia bacterium]|nr:vitamin K epoxide reductase family protein [Candidatus Binatia bacterium]